MWNHHRLLTAISSAKYPNYDLSKFRKTLFVQGNRVFLAHGGGSIAGRKKLVKAVYNAV